MTEQRSLISLTAAESRRVTEELVRSIPEPEFTPTWHPHSHAKVIDATAMAVKKLGLEVGEKTYSLWHGGAGMHGLWEVGRRNGKMNCVGFRNSMDMSVSVGYLSILTIVVCTNQITNANWFILRKHTSGLTIAELGELAFEAISQVVKDFDVTDQWHEGLKEFKLEKRRIEQLTVRAMREDVLVPSKFKEFDKLLFGTKEEKPIYDQTLYGFHGALTQLIRDHNLGVNTLENKRITAFVDSAKTKATH